MARIGDRGDASQGRLAWSLMAVAAVLFLWLAGCGDAAVDDTGDGGACTPGLVGCDCGVENFCQRGAYCGADGVCAAVTCAIGSDGCACYDNGTCDATSGSATLACGDDFVCRPDVAVCPPGSEGCACVGGACLGDGLTCEDVEGEAICVTAGCAPGELGCTCPPSWQCGLSDDGERLACDGTRCVEPSCTLGQEGCYCGAARGCDTGLLCDATTDRCEPASCLPGSLGCGCDAGVCDADMVCANDRCEPASCMGGAPGDLGCGCVNLRCGEAEDGTALACVQGVCVASEGLREGTEGGECYRNSTCNPGLRCDAESFACVDCVPGQTGCDCRPSDSGCVVGLACVAGRCLAEEELVPTPPEDPVCYSPCSEGVELPDGTYRACSPDGLMLGCLGARTCVNGSCLAEGERAPVCATDLECPDFQACIAGSCYSNCAFDTDCSGGLSCHRAVCRVPCAAGGSECGSGQFCETQDGTTGYCMPLRASAPEPVVRNTPSYTVSATSIAFSNARTSSTFSITNETETAQVFLIRKLGHNEYDDAGLVQIGYRDADGDGEYDDNPLQWIRFGTAGDVIRRSSLELVVDAGATVDIALADAANEALIRWEGVIEVSNDKLGSRRVRLEYATRPDGQWTGSVFYFTNFDDTDLGTWLGDRNNSTAAQLTNNAFLAKWTGFRVNPLFTLEELMAVLNATVSGSWNNPSVREACDDVYGDTVERHCYLFVPSRAGGASSDGIKVYTADVEALRIPSGVLEMPFAMNLETDPADPTRFVGRLNTADALQFPGNPAVELQFSADPSGCQRGGTSCVTFVESFAADVVMGARYQPEAAGDCGDSGLAWREVPWLIDEFLVGTTLGDAGLRRGECRESRFPVDAFVPGAAELNASLAAANPIPDGRARVRRIELVDGAYVNQETLVLIIREEFDSYFGGLGDESGTFSSYGIVTLRRTAADLGPDDYLPGIAAPAATPPPSDAVALECDVSVIEEAIGVPVAIDALTDAQARELATTLIVGAAAQASPSSVAGTSTSAWSVNYLCEDTGRFNGGPSTWTASVDGPEECPYGSGVRFFLLPKVGGPALGTHACNAGTRCGEGPDACTSAERGTCGETLDEWVATSRFGIIADPGYTCVDGSGAVDRSAVVCQDDRSDLRANRQFFVPSPTVSTMAALSDSIDRAFRYKTRFRSRTGGSLAFVPAECSAGGDAVPYCYDPVEIEAIRSRIDCLVAVYANRYPALSSGSTTVGGSTLLVSTFVRDFLATSFSFEPDALNPESLPYDGFERLYSELLIMLGDDAYVRSLASRFDLAGTAIGSFEGDLFEPEGLRLSGGAGFQLRLLYQSMQYHDLVIDRFFRMAPTLWANLDSEANFVNIDTIATYLNRVINASTRKAQVASEVARLYQSFNRADLARHVVERSYAQTYLESVALSQFVRRTARVIDPRELPAVQVELDNLQRQYRVAMQRMREGYQNLTDERTVFGFSPDYIPFPTLRYNQEDAVNVLLDRALDTLTVAREREDRALESNRSFDTDAARFQAELVAIRNQYENELASVCGTFTDVAGNVYPAIPKYASVNGLMTLLQNPCGLVGNGTIYQAIGDIERANADLRIAVRSLEEIFEQVEIEAQRVEDTCGATLGIEQLEYTDGLEVVNIQDETRRLRDETEQIQREIGMIERQTGIAQSIAQTIQLGASTFDACTQILPPNPNGCAMGFAASIASGIFNAFQVIQYQRVDDINESIEGLETDIRQKQNAAAELRRTAEFERALRQCCLDASAENPEACDEPGPVMVDAQARIDTLMVDLKGAELNVLRSRLEVHLAQGALAALRNRSDRLIAQQEESEQLLINVESARNNPNVRIYRNSAVIDADTSFEQALQDAYRATRVYEYYTSTTYAARDELFLARMVARGDYNLEGYVRDLQRAFRQFEELYGLPSDRVHVLSLRDDIFQVPMVAPDGAPLTQAERVDLFRAALLDVDLLDDRGAIAVPFATTLSMTSPLTASHKLTGVEIEVVGSDVGDRVGRVYVTARGTGVVRSVSDERLFYRFPETTAVVNSYFNGVRAFGTDVYRSGRFRDRPFVNSLWELGINQRDESVNEDISLSSLTDIRVYFFYADFTRID